MRKLFPLVLIMILLSGCDVSQDYTFKQELFSVSLPAAYSVVNNVIQPENDGDFPQITFDTLSQILQDQDLVAFENDWILKYGGKMISNEKVSLNGYDGIKFVVQHEGRNKLKNNESSVVELEPGYTNEYHYTLIGNQSLIRLWTSADDSEDLDTIEKVFDKIIGSISKGTRPE